MKLQISSRAIASKGFTLVELMVVILVIAIIAAIAVPSYSSQVRKSRRTEARNALLDAAAREERFYATNNFYSVTAAELGYDALPANVGGNYYKLSVACTLDANNKCSDFTLTATAINTQAKDTACATFTLNQTGLQNATGSATAQTTCWN